MKEDGRVLLDPKKVDGRDPRETYSGIIWPINLWQTVAQPVRILSDESTPKTLLGLLPSITLRTETRDGAPAYRLILKPTAAVRKRLITDEYLLIKVGSHYAPVEVVRRPSAREGEAGFVVELSRFRTIKEIPVPTKIAWFLASPAKGGGILKAEGYTLETTVEALEPSAVNDEDFRIHYAPGTAVWHEATDKVTVVEPEGPSPMMRMVIVLAGGVIALAGVILLLRGRRRGRPPAAG